MRIKSLAQGENILTLGIEPSTFVSKVDILTTTPIVLKLFYVCCFQFVVRTTNYVVLVICQADVSLSKIMP